MVIQTVLFCDCNAQINVLSSGHLQGEKAFDKAFAEHWIVIKRIKDKYVIAEN